MDTRDKRSSAIYVGLPWRGMLPTPDGLALDQGDRQQTGLMYRGILATAVVARPAPQPPGGFWIEEWERLARRLREKERPVPDIIVAIDEVPQDWTPSKTFKVSPAVIEALAQARSIDDIRELARQETGQVRNMLNTLIAEYKRRVRDEDDIEVILMTLQ